MKPDTAEPSSRAGGKLILKFLLIYHRKAAGKRAAKTGSSSDD